MCTNCLIACFHHMGVSENVVYPIVPNGFADQTIPMNNG